MGFTSVARLDSDDMYDEGVYDNDSVFFKEEWLSSDRICEDGLESSSDFDPIVTFELERLERPKSR